MKYSKMASKISPLPLKVNVLTKEKYVKNGISKKLKFIFVLVLAFMSLDFGFVQFKSTKVRILVQSLCALQTLIISSNFLFFYSFRLEDVVFKYWYCTYIFKYIILVFVLLFIKKPSFSLFCDDLWAFDVELGVQPSNKLDFMVMVSIASCLSFRCMLSAIYCTILRNYCIEEFHMRVIFFVPLMCADMFLIVYSSIYLSLFDRLKVFTDLVSNGRYDVVASQYLYKAFVDIADNIKSVYDPLYGVPLLLNTIDMMITVFYPLIQADVMQDGPLGIAMTNLSVLQVFIMLFFPAYAAGLLCAQVDQLKIVLHDRLLQEREQNHVPDIERFIRYIEVRPLKTVICKVIPLNWQLPVSVVQLSITYLIVMLQFTHKY